MQQTLDLLVKVSLPDAFELMRQYESDERKQELLLKKGVYLASTWMHGCIEDAFYSKLKGEGIKNVEYEHAQGVWKEFGIKNLGEYHDLYLKTDVTLLTDVFEHA